MNNDNQNPYGPPPGPPGQAPQQQGPQSQQQGYAQPQPQPGYGPAPQSGPGPGPMQPYGQQPMQPWYGPQPMQYGPQPGYGPAPMGYGAPAPINIVVQNTANAANVGGGGGGLVRVGNKSKGTAAVLAIFLGGLGAHKFYLGQPIMGILYLFMAWTFLPAIVGFFEGIIYLTMNDHDFDMKYNFRLA